jgi:hypothetical protein
MGNVVSIVVSLVASLFRREQLKQKPAALVTSEPAPASAPIILELIPAPVSSTQLNNGFPKLPTELSRNI